MFQLIGDSKHLQKKRERILVKMGRMQCFISAVITFTYIAIYLACSSKDEMYYNLDNFEG